MRKSSLDRVLAAALAAILVAPACADELPACLRGCMAEKDDALRLACFDRETARLAAEGMSAAMAANGAPAVPVAAVTPSRPAELAGTPEERFGLPREMSRMEIARKTGAAPDLPELSATVSALVARPRGEALVTLQNGQIWVVRAGEDRSRLKVGSDVTIRRGALGSYLLYDGAGHALRVSRQARPEEVAR